MLNVWKQRFSGHSVKRKALTSVECGVTAGGSGTASSEAINSIVLSAQIVHQINFVLTCVHYANRFLREPIRSGML